MSQFLGPIHHIMWDRIKLVNERDTYVGIRVVGEIGPGAKEIVEKARQEHGLSWDERPLDEQVGDESIHTFLQDKVDRVEISEAALVEAINREYGERGREVMASAYYGHGKEFGTRLIDEAGVEIDDLDGIREILETYILEGMPCDDGSTSMIDENGNLIFSRPLGLHSFYWERVNVPPSLMVDLGGQWIRGLINGINANLTFERRLLGTMTEDRIGKGGEEKGSVGGSGNDFTRRVSEALDQIRPMLAMDGGGIELVSADPEKKTVAIRLVGACHGCAGAQMTLQYGVEKALRERIPELVEMEVV